jgi:hypothetical protein
MLQKMNLSKLNFKVGEKSPPVALLMSIPAEGTVPARASVVCSIGNVSFTTLKMQRPPAKKQMPVTRWIEGSWNQPIKTQRKK